LTGPPGRELAWLPQPWQFHHPEPGVPYDLDIVRYQVGLAGREITDPPYHVVRPTIRFHLPAPEMGLELPYVDYTNGGLITRFLATWQDLSDLADENRPAATVPTGNLLQDLQTSEAYVGAQNLRVELLHALIKSNDRPLTLQLTRFGGGRDTEYKVTVLHW